MSLRGEIYGSTIYTRSEIGLRPPRSITAIPAVEMVTVHYAGPSDWGPTADRSSPQAFLESTNHDRCDDIMRSHQNFHMDVRGWSDYAYNGAACPHGYGFIGRGKGVRSAAQGTTDGNNRSYAIQYMGAGTFGGVEDPLTEEAKRAFYDMAAYLDEDLQRGHRDWKSTPCPGEPTYAWRLDGFPKPEDDDMPLNAADKAWLTDMVRDQIVAVVLRSNESTDQFTNDPWKHKVTFADGSVHPADTVLRDTRVIVRRTEKALQDAGVIEAES